MHIHYFLKTHNTTKWYKAILSFTILTLLKAYSLLAWENNSIFRWLYCWLTFLSLNKGTKGGKKKAFSLLIIKLFNRSHTYFSTEFPWNLHALWQILTVIFQHNCQLNSWVREVYSTEVLPLDSYRLLFPLSFSQTVVISVDYKTLQTGWRLRMTSWLMLS